MYELESENQLLPPSIVLKIIPGVPTIIPFCASENEIDFSQTLPGKVIFVHEFPLSDVFNTVPFNPQIQPTWLFTNVMSDKMLFVEEFKVCHDCPPYYLT